MYKPISSVLRKLAKTICADYADTDQFTYTNPGNDYPSDISYDIWPGGFENNKENDPASKKEDEKNKWDTLRLGPGPTQSDWGENGVAPSYLGEPEPPKTGLQGECKDTVKSKGENADDLDRETYVGEGIVDSFSF
jgi:hypothetical protein